MDRWAGKVAVVTGASSGIGLSTARAFVQHGLLVVGLARRKEKMEKEMAEVEGARGKFYAVQCDISKDNEVADAFAWIGHNVGKVQILINNAGTVHPGTFTEVENAVLRKIIDVNLMGTVYCTKEALKVMQAYDLEGHIVNISSTLGYRVIKPLDCHVNIYVASKHAITAFSETLVRELMGQKIRVTNLSPGLVKTEMGAEFFEKPDFVEPYLEPEDIASSIIYVIGTPQKIQIKELRIPPLGETFVIVAIAITKRKNTGITKKMTPPPSRGVREKRIETAVDAVSLGYCWRLLASLSNCCNNREMSCLMKEKSYECRVSSVLNKEVKSYGKHFMFDGSEETCWNSDSGIPQWILVNFNEECKLSTIEIQFQGGFAGKNCHLEAGKDVKSLKHIQDFYPEDTNTIQIFKLNNTIEANAFKIVFDTSTDFFGRIIIYKLSLYP